MALEQYAYLAEIIGVIAVLVTLIFLSLQIHQNTKTLRSTSIQAALQSEMDLATMILDHANIWEKVVTGTELAAGDEMRRAVGLYNVFMIETENRFHQYHLGHLGGQSWEGRLGTLPEVVGLPIFAVWRNTVGARSHSADFLKILDDMADRPASD